MNCRIVFYSAKKTSYCEKALKKCVSGMGLNVKTAAYAVDGQTLGVQVIEAFADCDVVFVVGGLDFGDRRSVKTVISNAVKYIETDECKKLNNNLGNDGYLLRAGCQILVLLPDEPEQLEAVLSGCAADYLSAYAKSA
ncbi:MAG TPA: hypothetical protein DEO32_04470 [Ruminococcaceae bacterium]|nr:hypothetical protein [Oscillospiraceae bacterium]